MAHNVDRAIKRVMKRLVKQATKDHNRRKKALKEEVDDGLPAEDWRHHRHLLKKCAATEGLTVEFTETGVTFRTAECQHRED